MNKILVAEMYNHIIALIRFVPSKQSEKRTWREINRNWDTDMCLHETIQIFEIYLYMETIRTGENNMLRTNILCPKTSVGRLVNNIAHGFFFCSLPQIIPKRHYNSDSIGRVKTQ